MLVAMNWSVLAIDSCELLLTELRAGAHTMPIRVVHGDLTQFRDHLPEPAGLIICWGDTLTHLSSRQAADQLVEDAACALRPQGKLWLTFRDYASHELTGIDRFIHVRGDDQQQLTCFLEYHPEFVRVHDILHRRGPDGWTMTSSCYDKLRLPPAEIAQQLTDLGLSTYQTTTPTGMVSITAIQR